MARPTPYVDSSAHEAPADDFQPAFISASSPTTYVKLAIHGDNGAGKTRFAGTFPKPIFLALDPGYTVLRQLPNADDITVVRIPDPNRPDEATLRQVWNYYQWLLKGDHDRETVVVDSITELHKIVLDAVMAKPRERVSPSVPSTDDYIEVAAKLKSLIRYFRDLPMHVVFTAHSKTLKKRDDIIGIRPDLSDKLATELGGACDVILHAMAIEKAGDEGQTLIAYVGQTVPLNGVMAKDRSGKLRTPTTLLHFDKIAEAFGIEQNLPAIEPEAVAEPVVEPSPEPEAAEEEAAELQIV